MLSMQCRSPRPRHKPAASIRKATLISARLSRWPAALAGRARLPRGGLLLRRVVVHGAAVLRAHVAALQRTLLQ